MDGMVLNLEEDNVDSIVGTFKGNQRRQYCQENKKIASINVGEEIVGRVVDTLGTPIDGKGPLKGETYQMPLEEKPLE